jgi:prepilin-type N-terminal cleavage/methylation domain-containing protein
MKPMNWKISALRNSSTRGMTLVELMVVLVVLGVLAAIVSPSIFSSIRRQRAAGVAREITNELRRARNQAMSRGEAIVVEICGGALGECEYNEGDEPQDTAIITYATGHADIDGNYQTGGTACGGACTEDSDCTGAGEVCDKGAEACVPEGTSCRDGNVISDPARNCKDWDGANTDDFLREVARLDTGLDDSSTMTIRGFEPDEPILCFNPDGRAVLPRGIAVSGGGSEVCSGENWVLWVARDDATLGSEANCGTDVDDREPLDLYKVAVPFNGSIKMRQ